MSGLGGFCPLPIRLGGGALDGLTAQQQARIAADITAMSRVLPFAWVTFHWDGDPAIAQVDAYNGMAGNGPSYIPIIDCIGDSEFHVSWEQVQFDAYERPEPLAIRHAKASIGGLVSGYATSTWTMGESIVIIKTYDHTGAQSNVAQFITLRVT